MEETKLESFSCRDPWEGDLYTLYRNILDAEGRKAGPVFGEMGTLGNSFRASVSARAIEGVRLTR